MGRTSIIMIIVFNMTFMFMGYNLSTVASKAYEKYTGYSKIEQVGLALESAGNIAISNALLTLPPTTTNDTILCSNDTLAGATFTIHRMVINDPTTGTPDGDSLVITGKCPITINDITQTISCNTGIRVRGNSFAQFVFYSVNEQAINWMNNEVCRGRLHTQDYLYINGNPDFKGKVTTKKGVKNVSGSANFEQGHTYADISIPTCLSDLNKFGAKINGGAFYDGLDVYVQLNSDGSVTVRTAPANTGTNSSSSTQAQTVWGYLDNSTNNSTLVTSSYSGGTPSPKCTTYASVAALTSDGVLLVQNGELHVKGTLNGQITLGCVDTTYKIVGSTVYDNNLASTWIDGSITYQQPPPCSQYPSRTSDDMLGIVSTNNIMISQYTNHDNTKTQAELANVTIDASLFVQASGKGFGAENYDSRGNDGKLTIVGGIQQQTRNAVGTNSGSPSQTGFSKDYDWDNNLLKFQPKGYPKTPFMIQNWVDNTSIPYGFFD